MVTYFGNVWIWLIKRPDPPHKTHRAPKCHRSMHTLRWFRCRIFQFVTILRVFHPERMVSIYLWLANFQNGNKSSQISLVLVYILVAKFISFQNSTDYCTYCVDFGIKSTGLLPFWEFCNQRYIETILSGWKTLKMVTNWKTPASKPSQNVQLHWSCVDFLLTKRIVPQNTTD